MASGAKKAQTRVFSTYRHRNVSLLYLRMCAKMIFRICGKIDLSPRPYGMAALCLSLCLSPSVPRSLSDSDLGLDSNVSTSVCLSLSLTAARCVCIIYTNNTPPTPFRCCNVFYLLHKPRISLLQATHCASFVPIKDHILQVSSQ